MNKHSDLEERTVNDRSKPPKAAVLVAQQVVDEIIDRRLEPGEMLAQERDMIAQYGVGRATLREALRLLELEGALSIRPGPGGGPMVARPTPRHLASTFALVLQLTDDDFGSIWGGNRPAPSRRRRRQHRLPRPRRLGLGQHPSRTRRERRQPPLPAVGGSHRLPARPHQTCREASRGNPRGN
jgi:DNA-binding transcriptional MocR family regulator